MVAMLTVLPALLVLCLHKRKYVDDQHLRPVDLHGQRWVIAMTRRPWVTVAVTLVVAGLSAVAMSQVRYDNNLMDLYPEGLESVRWQEEVVEHSREAVWSAVSITGDLAEAKRLTERFGAQRTVSSVGGIGMLFPPRAEQKLQHIAEVREELGRHLERREPDPPSDSAGALSLQLGVLKAAPAGQAGREELTDQPEIRKALESLGGTIDRTLAAMRTEAFRAEAKQRMAHLTEVFAAWQERVRHEIDRVLATRPLRPEDLPAVLRRRAYRAEPEPVYVVEVYPGENVWEDEPMERFIKDLRSIDPHVTGVPVQVYESGQLIQRSYRFAAVFASLAVFILAWLDFMKLTDALLCLVPMAFGFVTMFAVMYLFGYSLNPANIIVLPLIFGIAVANGVHMMHRYQRHPEDHPPGLGRGTGKGILLTSATTIIAFASLLTAHHRGIRSLGFVLASGIALTLVACFTVMPALLELRRRRRARRRRTA